MNNDIDKTYQILYYHNINYRVDLTTYNHVIIDHELLNEEECKNIVQAFNSNGVENFALLNVVKNIIRIN